MFGRMIKAMLFFTIGLFVMYLLRLVKLYSLTNFVSESFLTLFTIIYYLLAVILLIIMPTVIFFQEADKS